MFEKIVGFRRLDRRMKDFSHSSALSIPPFWTDSTDTTRVSQLSSEEEKTSTVLTAVAKSSMRTSRYAFYEDPPQRHKERHEERNTKQQRVS